MNYKKSWIALKINFQEIFKKKKMKIVKVCNFCVLVMEANYCFKINKHISQHDDGEEAICSNIAWEFENVGYQGARSVWTITKVIKVPVNSYTFALVNAVKISWNNENNIFNHKKSKQIFKKKKKTTIFNHRRHQSILCSGWHHNSILIAPYLMLHVS